MIGMINKESIKMAMILIEATIPNSFNSLLSVMINVAKPAAVVILVIKVAFPILRGFATAADPAEVPIFPDLFDC